MLHGQIADKTDQQGEAVEPDHNGAIALFDALIFLRLLLQLVLMHILTGCDQLMLCNMQRLADGRDQRDIWISYAGIT